MALYVYGLAEKARALPPDVAGVAGDEVRSIDLGPLVALVGSVDEERELTVEDVQAHTAVLEAAFAVATVLPFRFAMVVEDEDALRAELSPRMDGYAAHLRRLAGKVELEVRATYAERLVLRRILDASPELRDLSRRVGDGASLDDRLEVGGLVAERMDERKTVDAAALDERLSRVATAVSPTPLDEEDVLRASYLVAAARVEDLVLAARAAGEDAPWMSVDVAGPVPPYSFSDPPEWTADDSQTWLEDESWTS